MRVVHFDIDTVFEPYFTDTEHYSLPLHKADPEVDFYNVEGVTIKSSSRVTAELLDILPKLRYILTRTVGTDHIDLEACKKRNVHVFHIPDYGAFNIAEHTFALLLVGARSILSAYNEVQNGIFSYKNHLGYALNGKTLGVIGTGKIGLEFIRRAKAFDMNVIAYDVYHNDKAATELGYMYVELEDLSLEADIVSLHAPLLDSTRHMIDSHFLDKMKKGSILINTSRGELIDTEALVKHVDKFRFVGLDVIEGESEFDKSHPLVGRSNVLITPHIAFFSDASVEEISRKTLGFVHSFDAEYDNIKKDTGVIKIV